MKKSVILIAIALLVEIHSTPIARKRRQAPYAAQQSKSVTTTSETIEEETTSYQEKKQSSYMTSTDSSEEDDDDDSDEDDDDDDGPGILDRIMANITAAQKTVQNFVSDTLLIMSENLRMKAMKTRGELGDYLMTQRTPNYGTESSTQSRPYRSTTEAAGPKKEQKPKPTLKPEKTTTTTSTTTSTQATPPESPYNGSNTPKTEEEPTVPPTEREEPPAAPTEPPTADRQPGSPYGGGAPETGKTEAANNL